MNSRTVLSLSALLVALAFSSFSGVFAAKYFRPDESKELFKLEKIPLQVDSMKELSRHLTMLAKREQDESAVQRRCTGQLLALAMRLDPGNQEARETNRAMLRDKAVDATPDEKIPKAKARLRFYQRWLASPDAGDDANALAKYITDASRILKPETLDQADSADWTGVMPPLDRYNDSGKKEKMPERTTEPKTDPSPTPKEKETPDPSAGYQITKLSVKMPLALETAQKYRDPKNNFHEKTRYITNYSICPVALSISPHQNRVQLQVKSKLGRGNGKDDARGMTRALQTLEKQLSSSSSGKDKGARVAIDIKSSQSYSSRNGSAALAAVQLMLHASRANKELRSDIHLCAALNAKGELCLPSNFWQVLATLRKDDGKTGRLIVPKAAAVPLTQLLVFGEPDFFTRWEVFTVATMDEALAAAVKKPTPDMAEATELYMPVRKLSGKSDVTKLAVNRAVRKRLSQVIKLAPNHLSAKTLLLQGSGHRPMRLSRAGLAYHIQPVVQHINSTLTTKVNPDAPSASALKALHDKARAELDPIERLVSRNEGELYEEALKLANDLRSLNLLIKRNARDQNHGNESKSKIKAMIFSLQGDATALETKINKAISDAAEK